MMAAMPGSDPGSSPVFQLKYGSTSFSLRLPPGSLAGVIAFEPTVTAAPAADIVRNALDACRERLEQFRPGEKVVIVTSDITRYTGSEIYLPLLVERLNHQGIPDSDIEILIALGIHRKQTDHEHQKILGPLHGRIRVSDHDCDDPAQLIHVGRTANGIDVDINRRAVMADRLILTGTIGFHYFAGYGGGRKSVLPGIASRQACMASHFAVLNPAPGSGRNPLACTGRLVGNPVHQAMLEACEMVDPDLLLNTIISPDKQIIDVCAGHWRQAHEDGCCRYHDLFAHPLRQRADLVVASCGG